MRKTFLKKAREALQEMRAQLLRNVQEELHEGREQTKDEGMDTYDLASDARDREINVILTDRDRDKLQAIDDALARIDAGTYGGCEGSESDIAEARLEALPSTRPSTNCQAERGAEARSTTRSEEARPKRRPGLHHHPEGRLVAATALEQVLRDQHEERREDEGLDHLADEALDHAGDAGAQDEVADGVDRSAQGEEEGRLAEAARQRHVREEAVGCRHHALPERGKAFDPRPGLGLRGRHAGPLIGGARRGRPEARG